MSEPDFEREISVSLEAARAAGAIIADLSSGARESWDKAEDSPVTRADLEANEVITRLLGEAFPEDAILSEETVDAPSRREAERLWVIDPLDGTKEFIAGVPEFSVSVALAIGGEPAVGVVLQPITREAFWGARGRGAYLNDQRLRVSRCSRLDESVMLSSRTELSRGQLDPIKGWFSEIRPLGSVALKLAFIAAGRADLWISVAPKSEWDVCAGDLLVREAGGIFATAASGPRSYNQIDVRLAPEMAAGPRALVETFHSRRSP